MNLKGNHTTSPLIKQVPESTASRLYAMRRRLERNERRTPRDEQQVDRLVRALNKAIA